MLSVVTGASVFTCLKACDLYDSIKVPISAKYAIKIAINFKVILPIKHFILINGEYYVKFKFDWKR